MPDCKFSKTFNFLTVTVADIFYTYFKRGPFKIVIIKCIKISLIK